MTVSSLHSTRSRRHNKGDGRRSPSLMSKSRKKRMPKRVLALPDLEQAKSAVLNTLTSVSGQRTYDHAINDFVEWYCSDPPRASSCWNGRTSPHYAESGTMPFWRCSSVAASGAASFCLWRWIPSRFARSTDLKGKAGHIRTVPVPQWVKAAVDVWSTAAGITEGTVFRSINKSGRVWGDGMTPKVLWEVVKEAASRAGIQKLAPHDLRRTCARLCHLASGELDQIQFLLGHVSIQTTERYLGMQAEAESRRQRQARN